MDENRNLTEILSRVEALDGRLRGIEEYKKIASDISDEALKDMRSELDSIRAALGVQGALRGQEDAPVQQENVQDIKREDYRTPPAAQQPVAQQAKPLPPRTVMFTGGKKFPPNGNSNAWVESPVKKVQRTNLSERNLGMYLLGVLGAVLVLLAAGVLVAKVWPVIPDSLKFLALLACGIGLQLVGLRFVLRSENRRNGFWLSITGLGAGVSLMSVAAGCIFWGLYPLTVAGALAAVWFGCNLLSARRLDSPVFYVIAYIGAAISVMLSVNLASAGGRVDIAPFRLVDQIPAAVMPVLILMLGEFAAIQHPRRCLMVLNYLASLFFIQLLGEFANELTYYVNVDPEKLYTIAFDSAPGVIIAPAILLIFVHLIHISPDALELQREKPKLDWLRALSVFIAGLVGMAAVYRGVNSVAMYAEYYIGTDPTAAVTAAVVTLVAAAVIMTRRNQTDYLLLGLTVPLTVLYASASDDLLDLSCLFPVILCALLFTLSRLRHRYHLQLALYLALALTWTMIISQSVHRTYWYSNVSDEQEMRYVLLFLAAWGAYMVMLCFTYVGEINRSNQSKLRHFTSLGCAVLIGLTAAKGAYMVIEFFLPKTEPEAVYPEIVALALLFHRWYVQARTRSELGTAFVSRILWSVCAGIFIIYLHVCIAFSSGLERGICIMVLMAMSGSSVAWAATSGSKVYAVLSVLFANEALAFAGGMTDVYGLTLSVLGVCLCAGFIWLGFFREIRTMRRLGLAGMIVYVLKIALMDVQSARGGVVSTALSLLFAGLVCFCVSFVYNRLDKKYGGGEE